MTAFALIAGALFRAPESKTSKAGKPYVTATIKVAADNALDFWNILAFSESAQTELMRLAEGDKIAVQGALKVETYIGRDGQVRINRTCMADHVLALRQPPREKKPKATPERLAAKVESPSSGERAFDDDIPF